MIDVNTTALSLAGAAALAAVLVLAAGPFVIPELHKLKFGQSIREEGPKSHQAKSGTPTMGGVMIIAAITLATLAAAPLTAGVWLALFVMLGHFALGFLDDYIKVVKKRNLGLKARQKLLGQIVIAVVVIFFAQHELGIATTVWLPLVHAELDIGLFYYPLVLFVLVGTSNAVNLTDGLDGLAAGTVTVAALAYTVVALAFSATGLAVFAAAIAGASCAFLRFNHHPARVFMGDTGSLALGGAVAALGILTHTEILLAVIGIVFVAEALSVIIQVISFKTTGKRVFLMSPIHHHFELKGWQETRVVHTFWLVGAVFAALGAWLAY